MVKGHQIGCGVHRAVLFPSLLTGQSFVPDQPFAAAVAVTVYYSRAVDEV